MNTKLLSAEQATNSRVIKFITEKGYELRLEQDVLDFIDYTCMNAEYQITHCEEYGQEVSDLVDTMTPGQYLDENWEKVTNRFYNEVICA